MIAYERFLGLTRWILHGRALTFLLHLIPLSFPLPLLTTDGRRVFVYSFLFPPSNVIPTTVSACLD